MIYSQMQAKAELEMFYSLSREEGILLVSALQSDGTPKNRWSIEKKVKKVLLSSGNEKA